MFKQSGHKVLITMTNKSYTDLVLCTKDVEKLMIERDDRSTRILKVEYNKDNGKQVTDYINKDLIIDIEVD